MGSGSVPPSPAMGGSGDDVNNNKVFAIIGYLIPILFFIPLVSDSGKKSPFAMFHANQQLNLLLLWIVGSILYVVLIGFLVHIFALICTIMGIINAAQGTMKRLPLIGGINILKS
ncbi:MAG: hypothetical protein A3A33_00185 [Candidatus Yanofskybacteria bacterium RIFCSPLOWO2_01_FULL_49_25]|uniref:DUF4870 domain-containing protein n=1 Tax=Candidatus Yanofskybacteria bacterium RIFCSPLOWO2_01_FULL_49_25 TaxID=1802701 RepID=A0A1F8GUJ5_9BACT|nr:MAG: hypothetical protein A3A33_00185 [Candidatus Yanofskybacteria bacterium RIFCSPLOWO2_01_FULL_49_25]